MMRLALLLVCLICAVPCCRAAQITAGGKSDWRLYVPENAGTVERFAADELTRYVKRISTVRLPGTRTPARPNVIRIGLRKDIDASDLPAPGTGFDGYVISVAEVKEGRAKKEDVEKQVAEARTVASDLISCAETLGAKNDGVMDAEWIKGWTINRTCTERLDHTEQTLKAEN